MFLSMCYKKQGLSTLYRQLYNKKQILEKQKLLKDIEEIRLSVTRNRERASKIKADKNQEDDQDRNDSCEVPLLS